MRIGDVDFARIRRREVEGCVPFPVARLHLANLATESTIAPDLHLLRVFAREAGVRYSESPGAAEDSLRRDQEADHQKHGPSRGSSILTNPEGEQ